MENELVTVVLPIYNVEKYLKKCIDSVLQQSYKNLEIILVNDGSTDNCLSICQQKANLDSRIKIISQENQGLSAARNTGIKNANGKYICFIDSDDYIHKDFIKLLLENLVKNDADISACDFFYVNEIGEIWSKKKKKNVVYSNMDAVKDIIIGKSDTEVMTWNKLYKLSLFKDNNINFPVGKLHEDKFTTYKLYYYSSKISLIPDKLYFYLQRPNSIMGSKFNIRRLDAIEAVDEAREFFKKKNIDMEKEIDAHEANMKIYILNLMIRANFDIKQREKIIKEIKEKKRTYIKNPYISKKMKFAITILIGNGKLYQLTLFAFDKRRNRGGI